MSCNYYKWQSGFLGGDYYCVKKEEAVSSDHYYRYCRDYNYDACPVYKHTESSGCYITTVTCGILGMADNNIVLNILRDFRNNVLQKDEQYKELLMRYDYIGPMIADNLIKEKNKERQQDLANTIYRHHLVPIANLVLKGNSEEAIRRYKKITEWLIVNYGLEEADRKIMNNQYLIAKYNPKKGGHGKKRIRTKTNKTENVK